MNWSKLVSFTSLVSNNAMPLQLIFLVVWLSSIEITPFCQMKLTYSLIYFYVLYFVLFIYYYLYSFSLFSFNHPSAIEKHDNICIKLNSQTYHVQIGLNLGKMENEFVQASKHGCPLEVPEMTHGIFFHIIYCNPTIIYLLPVLAEIEQH